MSYTYTTDTHDGGPGSAVAHADHCWEEWHAYLSADAAYRLGLDATGICCHTCSTVVLDAIY